MEKYIGKRPTSDQKLLASLNKKLLNQVQGIVLASEEKILKIIGAELDKKKVITAMSFYHVCHLIYHTVTVPLPRLVILLTKTTRKPYRPGVISLQGFLFMP